MKNKLKILLLEDIQTDAELIIYEIKKSGFDFDYKIVETEKEFIEELSDFKPDIILSDYNLPLFNGMDALNIRNKLLMDIPFIIITGSMNETIAVECIKAGADDYILKDNLTRLGMAIQSVLKKKEIIENKKKADIALHESEKNYRILNENIPNLIARFDKDLRHIYVNPSIEKLIGIKKEAIIGKTNEELNMPEDNVRLWNSKLNEVFSEGKIVTLEFEYQIQEEMQYFYSQLVPEFDDDNNIKSVLSIATNITERKVYENALADSNKFNKLLLQTFPFGMDIVDDKGSILFISNKLKETFGEEIIGKKCWTLYRDNKKQCEDCPLLKGINIGETTVSETSGVFNGRDFQISHTGMIYKEKKAILEIFQDITERKIAEQQLVIAKERAEESDKLKSAFLANMSHEIRTPMNAIIGFSELQTDPEISSEDRHKYTQIVVQRSYDLLGIINDILDISRMESGQLAIFENEGDVSDVFNDLFEFFNSKNKNLDKKPIELKMNIDLAIEHRFIITDFSRLKQILINLIGNSFKFTTNGYIEFGCRLTNDNKDLLFYVKDSGIGIAKDKQSIVFNRFRQVEDSYLTREFGGVGLGLSISKGLIDLMKGKIWLESELGEGSIFYFTLPYKFTVNPQDSIHVKKTNEDWSDNVILIVEDDVYNAEFIINVLKATKIKLYIARSGIKATELIDLIDKIDLILMDIKLPDISGFELTSILKQKKPNIPIIAQTAFASESDRNRCLDAGCNDFISKPINQSLLKCLIQKYLNN